MILNSQRNLQKNGFPVGEIGTLLKMHFPTEKMHFPAEKCGFRGGHMAGNRKRVSGLKSQER